jgi:hypothetical protein
MAGKRGGDLNILLFKSEVIFCIETAQILIRFSNQILTFPETGKILPVILI